MTQLDSARGGEITPEMIQAAEAEGFAPEKLMELIALGRVVLPKNKLRSFRPVAIGEGLKTKVNANIGTSPRRANIEEELMKMNAAVEAGADAVMDLSTGGDLNQIRKEILARCPVPLGTVPLYQVATQTDMDHMDPDMLFDVIRQQAEMGVDFMTVHCGVTKDLIPSILRNDRIIGVVSRGGSLLIAWMTKHGQENPLYEQYDRLLDIASEYDVTLSLGDGLRPGSVCDATDRLQLSELHTLAILADRAKDRGVQVMIEGPGHVPLHEVAFNVEVQKKMCRGAPFYVLGPLTTDIAPGYDHITSAIGGAVAAAAGADFLCYVTPAEHLRLPTVEDVRLGVIAARIAAHSADIVKGVRGALERDREMSRARKNLDWEAMYRLSIDPEGARSFRRASESYGENVCSMCGQFCAIHIDSAYRSEKAPEKEKETGAS